MDVKKPFLTRFSKPAPEPHGGSKAENPTPKPPLPGTTTITEVRGETTDDG